MNTEKMSIEEFRSIKKQMNDLILESNSLEEKNPEKSAVRLVQLANEAGGTDNITVITARL